MRISATFIGVSACIMTLFLAGCTPGSGLSSVMPQFAEQNRKELDKAPGPNVAGMEAQLKSQGDRAMSMGDCKQASQTYKQLSDLKPDNNDYALMLADSLRRCGQNETALKISELVLKRDSKNALAGEIKGLCLLNLGEFTESSTAFGEVMKVDPKRWRTLNGIGILFTIKNMNTEAIAYYKAALEQNPDNLSILNNMALSYAMDKNYDKSVETFMHAKHHAPHDSPEIKALDLNLALVYAIEGKLDEAEQTASPHLSKAALYNNMAFYAYLAKNTELAKGYLNMALTQSPTYYERAWKNLGIVSGEPVTDTDKSAGTPLDEVPGASPGASNGGMGVFQDMSGTFSTSSKSKN